VTSEIGLAQITTDRARGGLPRKNRRIRGGTAALDAPTTASCRVSEGDIPLRVVINNENSLDS